MNDLKRFPEVAEMRKSTADSYRAMRKKNKSIARLVWKADKAASKKVSQEMYEFMFG